MTTTYSKFKTAFLIAAAAIFLLVVIEIFGAIDLFKKPSSVFATDGYNTVIRVIDGGPAQMAGFQEGDVLLKIDGIDIEDTETFYRRPRAKIGEYSIFTVRRGEDIVELRVTFSNLSTKSLFLCFASIYLHKLTYYYRSLYNHIIGLCRISNK